MCKTISLFILFFDDHFPTLYTYKQCRNTTTTSLKMVFFSQVFNPQHSKSRRIVVGAQTQDLNTTCVSHELVRSRLFPESFKKLEFTSQC